MKTSKTISSILFFAFLIVLYINLVAFETGIVGLTKKNGNTVGCVCHGFNPNPHVIVQIDGPTSVVINDTATYTLTVSGGPAVAAGCDITTSLGEVYPSYLDTILRRDESFPGAGFELTHKWPKSFSGGFAIFTFKYNAPSTPNVIDTLFANGNSVNLDTTSENDQWNYADNFLINILDSPQPVELSSFTSTVTNNNVELNWTTSSENNNAGFDIERSDNSGSWLKTGYVEGHGNSNTTEHYSFTDRNLNSGKHNYRLKQIDFNGNFEYYSLAGDVITGNPSVYKLSQNFPNPFNPTTKISFELTKTELVKLFIYDVSGKQISELINEVRNPGSYSVEFNGNNFNSGTYFYKIEAGNYKEVKKMVLVK